MRRFVCSPEDLGRYIRLASEHLHKEEKEKDGLIKRLAKKWNCSTRQAYFGYVLDIYCGERMQKYDIELDQTSLEFATIARMTLSFEDLHYAVHHMLWQIWDSGMNGNPKVPADETRRFGKITADCIYDERRI